MYDGFPKPSDIRCRDGLGGPSYLNNTSRSTFTTASSRTHDTTRLGNNLSRFSALWADAGGIFRSVGEVDYSLGNCSNGTFTGDAAMTYPCPYCRQQLYQLERSAVVTCPQCFESFRMPARADWLLPVVGLLVVNLYRLCLLA